MLTLKYDPKSRLATIADEVKLFWALCLSVVILFAGHLSTQFILLGFLIAMAIYGNVRPRYILGYLKLFLPVILIIFIFHLFYYDSKPLFKIWFLTATDRGLFEGILNLLRFINFLLLAVCFFSWTSPLKISTRLATFFGLAKGRFFQDLALVLFIALRFLPVLLRDREMLKLAMRARGFNFGGGFKNRLNSNVKIMFPLIARVAGQTDDVVAALALKGDRGVYFVPGKVQLKPGDILLIPVAAVLTIAAVIYG